MNKTLTMKTLNLPADIWCAVIFFFLPQTSLISILHTSKLFLRLGKWTSERIPLRVPGDFATIASAVSFAKLANSRIRQIKIGPGRFSLPEKPPPPHASPPSSATNNFPTGIILKNMSNLVISGTFIQNDGIKELQTTVLGQWDLINCSGITFQFLSLQSQGSGLCCVSKCEVKVAYCKVEFCKEKGVVFRSGSTGIVVGSLIAHNSGFAGILVHGYDTHVELSNTFVHKNVTGIWCCGRGKILLRKEMSISANKHYGLRVGFQARFIGSGGLIALEKDLKLTNKDNGRTDVCLENGGIIVENYPKNFHWMSKRNK